MVYKKLSILIPVYNEEKTIKSLIEKVLKSRIPLKKEIVIVDDGSTDKTRFILNTIKNKKMRVIFHHSNLGKGAAIMTSFKNSTGDIIIIQDADLEYNPSEYSYLLRPILDGKSEVVYGSRFLGKKIKLRKRMAIFSHFLGNQLLSVITSLLFFKKITDMETCYKCITRHVFSQLNIDQKDFRIEPQITTQIIKKGYKILELPISYNPRKFKEGKKINWKDGLKAVIFLIRSRFFS